jgi:hypothetical protein
MEVWAIEWMGEYLDGRMYVEKNEPMKKWTIE